MNDSEYKQLREKAWRRKLTASEAVQVRAYFVEHPQAQAEWEVEQSLAQQLQGLPDAPLASNFTAQVLQAVQRETAAQPGGWHWPRWEPLLSLRWTRPTVWAGFFLCAGMLTYHQYRSHTRAELAHSVVTFSSVTALPQWEWLQDFKSIDRMREVPSADDLKLLEYLQ